MILAKLKAWGLIFAGFVVTALSFLLLKEQRDSARKDAKQYKQQAEQGAEVARKDNVIEADFTSRRAEIINDLENGRNPDVFLDPNSMFRDDKDD